MMAQRLDFPVRGSPTMILTEAPPNEMTRAARPTDAGQIITFKICIRSSPIFLPRERGIGNPIARAAGVGQTLPSVEGARQAPPRATRRGGGRRVRGHEGGTRGGKRVGGTRVTGARGAGLDLGLRGTLDQLGPRGGPRGSRRTAGGQGPREDREGHRTARVRSWCAKRSLAFLAGCKSRSGEGSEAIPRKG